MVANKGILIGEKQAMIWKRADIRKKPADNILCNNGQSIFPKFRASSG
jgi:hypothetical protein